MREHDVTTLLRGAVTAPDQDLDVLGLRTRVRRRRVRRRAAAGGVVCLTLLAVVGALVLTDTRSSDEQVRVGPATTTTTAPSAGQLVRIGDYALDGTPDGMEITGGSEEMSSSGTTTISVLTLGSDVVGDLRLIITPDPTDLGITPDIEDERPAVVQLRLDGDDAEEVGATIRSSLDASDPIEVIVPLGTDDAVIVELPSGNDDATVLRTAQALLDHLRHAPEVLPGEAEDAAADAFVSWLSARGDVEQTVAAVQDGEALRGTIQAAIATAPFDPGEAYGYATNVEATGDHGVLAVTYEVRGPNDEVVHEGSGEAVQVGAEWLVSRETYCAAIAVGSVRCPEEDSLEQGD
jgi:hypothetical protein